MFELSTIFHQALKRNTNLIFKGRDIHRLQEIIRSAFGFHALKTENDRCLNAEVHTLALGDLQIIHIAYGANLTIKPKALADHLLLQIVLAGTATFEHESGTEIATSGFAALLEDPEQYQIVCSSDFEHVVIPLKRCMFAFACEKISARSAPERYGLERVFSLHGDALVYLLQYLLQQTERDSMLMSALAVPLEVSLTHELIANHSLIARHTSRLQTAVPACLYRAERYMMCNLEKAISLSQLASLVHTNPRTLSYNFQRFRSKSPLIALRDMRLEKIRELLLIGVVSSVTHIAMKYRFNHPGRFAAVYRKRFGELPSQTLSRTIGDGALRQKSEGVTSQ